jgi:C-terminal processing protease CtpA/Prc
MPCITLRQGTHGNVSLFGMEPGGELHRLCTVRCGDIIVEVDGKSALGLTEKEVRAMLCGQKGSICRISWIAPDKLDMREVIVFLALCRICGLSF